MTRISVARTGLPSTRLSSIDPPQPTLSGPGSPCQASGFQPCKLILPRRLRSDDPSPGHAPGMAAPIVLRTATHTDTCPKGQLLIDIIQRKDFFRIIARITSLSAKCGGGAEGFGAWPGFIWRRAARYCRRAPGRAPRRGSMSRERAIPAPVSRGRAPGNRGVSRWSDFQPPERL